MVQFSLDTVVMLYTLDTFKLNAAWELNDRGIGASLLTVSFSKSFLTWGQWCMVAQAPEWAGFESRRRAFFLIKAVKNKETITDIVQL